MWHGGLISGRDTWIQEASKKHGGAQWGEGPEHLGKRRAGNVAQQVSGRNPGLCRRRLEKELIRN